MPERPVLHPGSLGPVSSADPGSAHGTPRSRRHSNKPTHIPLPSPGPSGAAPFTPSGSGLGTYSSRPPSASLYREALADIHGSLYAGRTRQWEATAECIEKWYETDVVFENPLVRTAGRRGAADQFGLVGACPGEMWSEIHDLCESEDYHGNRIVLLSHTLHLSFWPAEDGRHGSPYSQTPFHSYPTTPFGYTPALGTPYTIAGSLPSPTAPPPAQTTRTSSRPAAGPLGLALAALHPRRVLARLGHFHIKILTRLEFNELGRVAYHEDTWGVKEVIEGFIPLLGKLYYFERKAAGSLSSWITSTFIRGPREVAAVKESGEPPCNYSRSVDYHCPGVGPRHAHGRLGGRASSSSVNAGSVDAVWRQRSYSRAAALEAASERLRDAPPPTSPSRRRRNWPSHALTQASLEGRQEDRGGDMQGLLLEGISPAHDAYGAEATVWDEVGEDEGTRTPSAGSGEKELSVAEEVYSD